MAKNRIDCVDGNDHEHSCLRKVEAGATFDNSFFDNSFVFFQQFKNKSFLGSVFVHVTGRSKN